MEEGREERGEWKGKGRREREKKRERERRVMWVCDDHSAFIPSSPHGGEVSRALALFDPLW